MEYERKGSPLKLMRQNSEKTLKKKNDSKNSQNPNEAPEEKK